MTLYDRYTYEKEILGKGLSIINRSTSNKLLNVLFKPVLLFACGIWGHSYWQKLKHSSNNVLLREV